ncbi:4447_t:CDS:2, partial [Dentiscutata erythropus]
MNSYKPTSTFEQYRSNPKYEEVIEMDNTRFIENETFHQSVLIQEQDDQLQSLYGTARNIHDIATTMRDEIDDQNMLLDEFGEHTDRTSSRLDYAMKKVKYIIKANE